MLSKVKELLWTPCLSQSLAQILCALQVAFRWSGDANIAIAIELPAGGEHTRMVPKVTDLQVAGVARVILSPLVPIIPGFGAAVIALRCHPFGLLPIHLARVWCMLVGPVYARVSHGMLVLRA